MGGVVDMVLTETKLREGFSAVPYEDHLGNLTFGYGMTVRHLKMTEDVAGVMLMLRLNHDLERCYQAFPWFREQPKAIRGVVLTMVFQMGLKNFSKFKNTINYFMCRQYQNASVEMLDSLWGRTYKSRSTVQSKITAKCEGM
jgi:GH24 family phage-related lysozyme (muramidase)